MATLLSKIDAARADRDASLPKEFQVDLAVLGLEVLPTEPIPRPTKQDDPTMEEPTNVYPSDNVMGLPRQAMPQDDLIITELSTTELLDQLATGKLSAVRCLQAFVRRAVLAQQVVNCLTDIFYKFALQTAQECDEFLAREKRVKGPLHGLPISLKDQFNVKGHRTVMGYAAFLDVERTSHSVITELLLRAGAVPFCHTNVPQTLMRGETDNHVYGRTLNPRNRSFTAGGSSGGEGALVAFRGSPLGVGTDIGGSVRIPAAFNGLWGFRPSGHRIPYGGSVNSMEGQESITSVIGPLSPSFEGCLAFMRGIPAGRPWTLDPAAMPMAFDEDLFELSKLDCKSSTLDAQQAPKNTGKTHLCFGIMWDNGIISPHPPITRALKEAKLKLENAGHTVIDWVNYDPRRASELVGQLYEADGGIDVARMAEAGGEPLMTSVAVPAPKWEPTVFEGWQLNKLRAKYQKEFLDHWQATQGQTGTGRPVDALLAPVAPWASCPHDMNVHTAYTHLWNLVDRPAVTFPVTTVQPELDRAMPDVAQEVVGAPYDPQRWAGMPVNLQLIGHRLLDEELLGIAKVVKDAGVSL
ncbi:unnamed protein product [Tilletia controversa]|uniref:amidase n=3 Tax=Tilletia TaxID=13289 RepID=A0A8X7STE7_9BASI|nr:hypothetical protein CF336_g7636 [Tilletia laevis]KAE8186015.1 hypothetical protein CF328_g7367 [Tilletia controversa]KAE8246167.1 hypothetical protein A4X03_0g7313 [Tilletia caries]KAE8239588.1 hypothetical protein A4X06_0g8186 [Tilletia controversa]CAD6896555.1 unnamed protein product [Tilletia controversa]